MEYSVAKSTLFHLNLHLLPYLCMLAEKAQSRKFRNGSNVPSIVKNDEIGRNRQTFLGTMFHQAERLELCLCACLYGPRPEKTCLRWFGNNTGKDQPAHLCSLISAFVIRFLESIISRLATSKISNF